MKSEIFLAQNAEIIMQITQWTCLAINRNIHRLLISLNNERLII